MTWLAWVVFVLVDLVVVGLMYVFWRAGKARRRMFEAWAARHGLGYADLDRDLAKRWKGTPFGAGHARKATEVLAGQYAGRPALSFTYVWTVGGGKSETTHTAHVVVLFLPVALPTLELTPEGFGTRVAKAFGGQDIQLESEDFNRAWRIEASDLRFAHQVLHPRLMHRLLEPDFARRNVRIEGDAILGWTGGRTVLDNVLPLMSRLAVVADAIPDHVWLDRGAVPPRRQGESPRPAPRRGTPAP
ncbi:hypothetical protein ACFWGN_15375 [Oerskovia sp. NPDC060338]|uniref:hypothetical protein n=1 Tax=Oerskovia sp. NPDC060338 TaxID=3347100 RepID=UPI00366893DA